MYLKRGFCWRMTFGDEGRKLKHGRVFADEQAQFVAAINSIKKYRQKEDCREWLDRMREKLLRRTCVATDVTLEGSFGARRIMVRQSKEVQKCFGTLG